MNQLIVLRIVCLVIGYVFGLFQTAYLLGKSKGIDIREHGSGNAGTTNAMRILGPKAGLTVFLGDMLKSLIAILLVGALFGKSHPEAVYLLKVWTFAGVVLGQRTAQKISDDRIVTKNAIDEIIKYYHGKP